ncbi:sensor histidine kinase [Baekduia soli]|nr:ATP-binding protein [Baekduia soli]
MGDRRRRWGSTRETVRADRWFALLTMTRVLGTAVAVLLLVSHRVTRHDVPLAALTLVWSGVTLVAFGRSERLRAAPAAWAVDLLAALALVLASGDWRSPFYIYALTTLVLPATALGARAAMAWGTAFSVLYAVVAMLTRQVPSDTLANTIRLETLATHLFVPLLVTLALAYSSGLLARLRTARAESERLALEAERRRIAWELHDSAKQRVHAAHLMLSALEHRVGDPERELVDGALAELRGATADMETSVAELRIPLDGRPVDELLRRRAAELELAGDARIEVHGTLPPLPPLVAAHTYRIAAEALTNAVRHASCGTIHVELSTAPGGGGAVVVADDGVGIPDPPPAGGHGLRSMRGRAETIGARLHIGPAPGGHGTRVALALPTPGGSP